MDQEKKQDFPGLQPDIIADVHVPPDPRAHVTSTRSEQIVGRARADRYD